MHAAYKLVFINITAFFVFLVGLFIYRYIFPKKTIHPLVIVIILSLLPLISLLRPGSYESGDFSYNIYNSILYYSSLSEGHILPSWAGISNATFGYPLFIFIYPLPYIFVSLFHFLGFSFVASLKIFITICFVFSGVFMYLFINEIIGKRSAVVAAIFYLFAPYHLVDMHFRVSTGEIASFSIIPAIFYCIVKALNKKSLTWHILLSLNLALLMLSNQAIAIFGFVISFLYLIFYWWNKKKKKVSELILACCAYAFSLLLSAFYWVPVILESKFTHQAEFVAKIGYVEIWQFLFSPYRFGLLFQGPKGELSFLIGYAQIIVIFTSVYFLFKKRFKTDTKTVLFFSVITFAFCFLMTTYSQAIWENIKILKNFQFTFRLLIFVCFSTSVLAAFLSNKLGNILIFLLCTLVILQSILNWGNRRTIPEFDDKVLESQIPLNTATNSGFHPAVPKWVDINNPWFTKIPKNHLEVVNGEAKVTQLSRTSTNHSYLLSVTKPTLFKENTAYFPGWNLKLNKKDESIQYSDKRFPGVITFKAEPGVYLAEVNFEDTQTRKIAKVVSLISGVTLIFIYLIKRRLTFLPKL